MAHVYRRPADQRLSGPAPALLFPAGLAGTVILIAAGAVTVAGQVLSLLSRAAVNLKRFAVSLNDING